VRNRLLAFASLIPLVAAAAACVLVVSGCSHDAAARQNEAAPPAPQVTVARVISRTVTNSETFSGRFDAVDHVDVRPRVTGYISSVDFVDGTVVHKGQVLFVIDPRPYQADYQRAAADLDQARAQAALARAERLRAVNLFAAHAISKDEFDTRTANARQSAASVEAAKAAVDAAALNLTFTRVTAPITGRVSRAIVTAGNLVTNGQTLLTTIVSLNPIYVEFNADEQAYLNFEKYAGNGATADSVPSFAARDGGDTHRGVTRAHTPLRSAPAPDVPGNPVYVGLADEKGYPHEGHLVFMDNSLDAETGTIYARALLANPGGRFVPGLFARVKLIGNERYPAVLVNDSAIGTDQTLRYVLLLGPDNKVQLRPVELGPLVDGLRVVRSGLKPGDTIIVNGLMRVRPGMQVAPQLIAMGEHRHSGGTMVAANTHRGSANDGSADTSAADGASAHGDNR
jgi:RND family efflux transporter MFP subunit